METFVYIMAAAAPFFALIAIGLAKNARSTAEDVRADVKRQLANQSDAIETALGSLRELLARQAAGEVLDPEQIREGRLWRDICETDARTRCDGNEFRILDVRSHQETSGGVIPGALLIPVDELEARHHELADDPRPTLIVCAMGGRSAAACEFLSKEGYFALFNLEGGMSGWRGQVERPA